MYIEMTFIIIKKYYIFINLNLKIINIKEFFTKIISEMEKSN